MPVYFPFAQPVVPPDAVRFSSDLKNSTTSLYRNYFANLVGATGGAAYLGDSNDSESGMFQLQISAVGQSDGFQAGLFWLPYAEFFCWQCNIIPTNLSDGTNRYAISAAISDGTIGYAPTGVGFIYSDNINNGRWQCYLQNGLQFTTIDTLADCNVTRNALKIVSPGSTGPYVFYINDVIVGAITPINPMLAVTKTAIAANKLVGGTSRTFRIDYYGAYWRRSDIVFD
jgi:hypothetical protein